MQPFFLPWIVYFLRSFDFSLGEFDANILNQMCNNKCRILVLNVIIDAKNFVLIYFYNPNTENEQVEV